MCIHRQGTEAENTAGEVFEDKYPAGSHARIRATDIEEIGKIFFEYLDRFRMGAPAYDDTTYLVVGLD
ncbi:MAG TPA: hypothetical protein VM095_17505 [Pyrinomonadaceae bacterium]|nr:hypothetical protein [Pyrinomonadaceae bacterium]